MIQLTGIYNFDQWHEQGVSINIIDPQLEINPKVKEVDPIAMTIQADIKLHKSGSIYGMTLKDIPVINLDYNESELGQRVVDRLNDFKLK